MTDSRISSMLRQARHAKRLTQAKLAGELKVSQSAVAQWESGRSFPSEDLLPKLEKLLGLKLGALEDFRSSKGGALARRPMLGIIGQPIAGEPELVLVDSRTHGQIAAPPQLEGVAGAAAVYARGSSMEPRYFAGELVYLHPGKPPNPGDFVFVVFNQSGFVTQVGCIRQYVAEDLTHIHLRTLSPKKEHLLPREALVAMLTIVGSGLF